MPTTLLLSIGLLAAVAGCGSKATRENYDRVESGISRSEAISILGEPDEFVETAVGPLSGATATWRGDGLTITIQFVNDKVALKEIDSG